MHHGAPNTATTASPMNFSTVPPGARAGDAGARVRAQVRLDVLGVELFCAGRETDEVCEHDGHDLALTSFGRLTVSAAPQAEQKRASGALSRPQDASAYRVSKSV